MNPTTTKNEKLTIRSSLDGASHQVDKCKEFSGLTIYCQIQLGAFMKFMARIESEPDVEYEFNAVLEEYDPCDPDEALRYEYYNPNPLDYIDALRAGYTFDSMVDPI